jgi:hypothetical protein
MRKAASRLSTLLFAAGVVAVVVVWVALASALGFGLVLAYMAWSR